MPTLDIDEKYLAEIRSEIGYRLSVALDRDQRSLPPELMRLVRALDDAHRHTTSPSIVPDGIATARKAKAPGT